MKVSSTQLISTTGIIILLLCCIGNGNALQIPTNSPTVIVTNVLFNVDPSAAQFDCSIAAQPNALCPDIYSALLAYQASQPSAATGVTIQLAAGTYTGVNNTNLNLYNNSFNNSILITSSANNDQVTIDMQNNGNFINVNDKSSTGSNVMLNITIENISITNGNQNQGVALNITTSNNTITYVVFNNVVVSNCQANTGAVASVLVNRPSQTTVTFTNSQFINNTAAQGTVYFGSGYGTVSFVNSVISKNTVTNPQNSGIIRALSHTVSISNLTMNNNVANGELIIFTQSPRSINIDSLNLNNNQISGSSTNSSAFLVVYASQVAITNSIFTNNLGAPVIYYSSDNTYYPNRMLVISGSTFNTNTGSQYGGCLYLDVGSAMNMNDCTFTSNSAVSDAGVIYLLQSGTVTISNSTFTTNTVINANASASVIYADTLSEPLSLTNVYIEDNTNGSTNALPINCEKSTIDLSNVTSNIKNNLILKCNSTCKVNGEQFCSGSGESSENSHHSSENSHHGSESSHHGSENSHHGSGNTLSFNFTSIIILILSLVLLN